jgi:hypothetical protein
MAQKNVTAFDVNLEYDRAEGRKALAAKQKAYYEKITSIPKTPPAVQSGAKPSTDTGVKQTKPKTKKAASKKQR